MTYDIASQAVSWWSVHQFAAPRLQKAGDWPLVGTPAWCLLETRDPSKWAAILDASQHWALRLETCHQLITDAGRSVAESTDWSALARQLRDREDFYRARPYLKRRADR
jgi:Protein of unknown function (DUF2742)